MKEPEIVYELQLVLGVCAFQWQSPVLLCARVESKTDILINSAVPSSNVNLLRFSAAGYATAELDLDDEVVLRWRGFIPPQQRGGGGGYLADAPFFARYRYHWSQEDFLLYVVVSIRNRRAEDDMIDCA